MLKMLKEIKAIKKYLIGTSKELSDGQLLGYFEYGSTFQGTADEYSDKDIMVIYQTSLEDMLFNKSEIKSKKIDTSEFGIVLVPLQEYYHLLKKGSYDSYLKLDAMLDCEYSKEVSKLFEELYIKENYRNYVNQNKWLLLNSLKGNLKGYIKTFESKGMDGKLYIKIHYLISMYSKLIKEDIEPCKFSKLSGLISKDITKYKRMTSKELSSESNLNVGLDYGYIGIGEEFIIKTLEQFKDYCYQILSEIEYELKIHDKDKYKGKVGCEINKLIENKIKELYRADL